MKGRQARQLSSNPGPPPPPSDPEQPGSQAPGATVTMSEESPIFALSMPGSSGRPRQMRAASVSDHRLPRQAPASIRGSLR
jgi:hypothetical protein